VQSGSGVRLTSYLSGSGVRLTSYLSGSGVRLTTYLSGSGVRLTTYLSGSGVRLTSYLSGSGVRLTSYLSGSGVRLTYLLRTGAPLVVKRAGGGGEVNHSPPTSAEVKKTLVYTSAPTNVFKAWCLSRDSRIPA
jgi:hypothetical protein